MSSKKRKHNVADDSIAVNSTTTTSSTSSASQATKGSIISIHVSSDAARDGLKPVLANTPSVPLPSDAKLTLYERKLDKGKERERSADKEKGSNKARTASMLHGESSKLEWTSTNRLFGLAKSSSNMNNGHEGIDGNELSTDADLLFWGEADDDETSASYALAIYDPSASTLSTIPAPLHILSHVPKRLKSLPSAIPSSQTGPNNNAVARAELGLSFGTKKSIRAIRAAERNKVDAGAKDLQDLKEVVVENLDAGLETLASSQPVVDAASRMGLSGQEAVAAALADTAVEAARRSGRPVPNLTAEKPEDVYPITDGIILAKEMEGLDPTSILYLTAEDKMRSISMIPYRKSTWINDRIKELVTSTAALSVRRRRGKILLWISALMQLRTVKGGIDPNDEAFLEKQFGRCVRFACSSSLIERFTEGVRGTRKYVTLKPII